MGATGGAARPVCRDDAPPDSSLVNPQPPTRPDADSAAFPALVGELARSFRAWGEADGGTPADGPSPGTSEPWPDGRFEELALRAFGVQFAGNRLYRRYCEARDAAPASVTSWRDVPPVPTAVFREVGLVTGEPEGAVLEFRTSGTTRGEGRRGRHLVREPALYRASLEAAFRRFVLRADGIAPLDRARFLSLVPRFGTSGSSSLSWMAEAVVARFGRDGGVWAAGADGLDLAAAGRAARNAAAEGEPLCVLATTLALDAWTRRLAAGDAAPRLPRGSRIMDTGGSKGREGLRRSDVLGRAEATLGVPSGAVVNEFGMTELLSQRYSRHGEDDAAPWLHAPPWLATRALDPVDLEAVPPGEEGILCHFDLANLGSVSAVLTEDRGRVREDGAVRWLGRTPGSPPRGCSLATAELLEARG